MIAPSYLRYYFSPIHPIILVVTILLMVTNPSSHLWSADPSTDPLADVYAKEIRSTVESLILQFRRDRKYKVADFPLEPEAFERFKKEVVEGWTAALGMEKWVVRNPSPGKKSPIEGLYRDRIVKWLTLEDGVKIEAHVIEIIETGDQVPVVICLPAAKSENPRPGILCCPGHGNHPLRDLVFDPKSYQRAIAVRLAKAGFVSVAVEKVDCGYLSRSAPVGNDEIPITTFRFGLRPDTRTIQLMATMAATEVLATHPQVDETRIGATGVSLGGWLAMQTALLSDRIQAVAEYATKTVFLGDNIKPDEFKGVGDLCHIVPGSFQLGDRNILMFPYAPRPLLSGHGGPKDKHSHREYQQYYLDVYKAQYEALGKPENFRYHIHDGGHVIPPETVIGFFREQFRFPE